MLTSKDLIDAGIKPGPLFGTLLKCDNIDEARSVWQKAQSELSVVKNDSIKMWYGSMWWWLCNEELFELLCSTEFPGKKASNSERRRWLENKAVLVNGLTPGPDDVAPFSINQLVFFHNSEKRRITMQ